MKDQVPDDVKKERSEDLLYLSLKLHNQYEKALEGRIVEVLAEEEEEKDGVSILTGYTKEYVRISVPGYHQVNEIVAGKLIRTENGCILEEIS